MRSPLFLSVLLVLVALLAGNVDAARRPSRNAGASGAAAGAAPLLARAAASSDGIVALTSPTEFTQLLKPPRSHATAMLLTAVDSGVPCPPCHTFQPTWKAIAKSWRKKGGKDKESLVFASIEFKDGKEVFSQLQLTYAPVLLFFPASADGKAEPGKYDFNRLGFDDTTVADFLSTQLGYKFPYSPPFPWGAVLTFSGACLVMAGAVLFVLPKLLAESSLAALAASGAKAVCMALSLGTIVIMCAGHMWNTIRAPPYMQIGSSGQAEYFAQGFQNQYAAETHIVAAFYALLAFSVVTLIVFVPAQRDAVRQRAGVYIWSAILLGTFSMVLAVFRIKNPSYPFRIFF